MIMSSIVTEFMDYKKDWEVAIKSPENNIHVIDIKALNVTEVVKQIKNQYDTEIISIKRKF